MGLGLVAYDSHAHGAWSTVLYLCSLLLIMRGRDLYRLMKGPLQLTEAAVSLLPSVVVIALMRFVRYCPAKLGVGARFVLLRKLAGKCGDCVAVFEGVYLFHLENMKIGSHVSIHPMCYVDAVGGIVIGDHVSIAHSVTVMTAEHDYTVPGVPIREAQQHLESVSIGNDVWIGAGVRILAGVEIGDRSVVGAGSVVKTSIPANSIAVGVPARVIKQI